MSSYNIIDRRKNPRGKNLPNRQRFIERARQQIKDRLQQDRRSITSEDGQEVVIDADGIGEPNFGYDRKSGKWKYVLPGNRDFVPGDRLPKPNGSGSGSGSQAGQGQNEDSFSFRLTKDEYLDIVFEGLELPDLVKKSEKDAKQFQSRRSGLSKQGSASNLDLPRSLRNSLGRRIALAFPLDRQIRELEHEFEQTIDDQRRLEIQARISELRRRRLSVAYIDPVDIRYRRFERVPVPNSQAVMFCVMDVSASMTESRKEVAKRFFLLLYLFLTRKYTKVDIVFVRHTDSAKEVNEEDFFYSTESGGTAISSGVEKMEEILQDRYRQSDWNIYCVQASDGDNMSNDTPKVIELLDRILPLFQYYVYSEISSENEYSSDLYDRNTIAGDLARIKERHRNLEIIELDGVDAVVPTFRHIFAKNDNK